MSAIIIPFPVRKSPEFAGSLHILKLVAPRLATTVAAVFTGESFDGGRISYGDRLMLDYGLKAQGGDLVATLDRRGSWHIERFEEADPANVYAVVTRGVYALTTRGVYAVEKGGE